MKTKQVIYLGLAILLSSASLTSLPTRVSAAESSRSSASISSSEVSESSTSEESTTSASESSKSESSSQSVMLSRVSESSVSVAESAATKAGLAEATKAITRADLPTEVEGIPDKASEPSPVGFWFLVTLRNGWNSQPQPLQYVVAGDTTTNKTRFEGIQLAANLFTDDINGLWWKWDGTKWNKVAKQYKIERNIPLFGMQRMKDFYPAISDPGAYAFQFDYKTAWTPIFKSQYFSKFAVVIANEKPVSAINIDTDIKNVIYSDVNYPLNAKIAPTNATDLVSWKPASSDDKLTFSPAQGRATTVLAGNGGTKDNPTDTYYTGQSKMNTDVNAPGVLANFNISAGAAGPKYKSTYVGGLVAREVAQDVGLQWSVAGLADLATDSPSTKPWKYQWQFFDGDGKVLAKQPTSTEGVTNTSGSVANLATLNDAANILTFSKDSSFMATAAKASESGKHYRAQVTFTTETEVENSSGNLETKTIAIKSNVAQLRVTPAVGELSLDAVPDFNFGSIPVSKFYNGTNNDTTAPTATGDLAVSDTRVPVSGVKNDWTLSATATDFKSDKQSLTPVTLQLSSMLGATTPTNLTTGATNKTVISTKATASVEKSSVAAKMLINPNPKIQLTDGESFASTITWDLTPAAPTALAAK